MQPPRWEASGLFRSSLTATLRAWQIYTDWHNSCIQFNNVWEELSAQSRARARGESFSYCADGRALVQFRKCPGWASSSAASTSNT
jgi:hypothetical protein